MAALSERKKGRRGAAAAFNGVLRGFGGVKHRKVDVRLSDSVEVVGEHIFGDQSDDLDELSFAEAGLLHRGDISVANAAAGLGDLDREADRGASFRVGGQA